ncbi:MAG TPA: hypothetical protein PLM79_12560 [Syntrophobacteraceae bacterium]|nr:hypothetical protein [Syntrophobacteraceae bacterium]
MIMYVKDKKSNKWHWCENCSNYPTSYNVETRSTKPNSDLCDECKAKEKAGECRQ